MCIYMNFGKCGIIFYIGPFASKEVSFNMIHYTNESNFAKNGNYFITAPGGAMVKSPSEFIDTLNVMKKNGKIFMSNKYTPSQIYKIAKKMKVPISENDLIKIYSGLKKCKTRKKN